MNRADTHDPGATSLAFTAVAALADLDEFVMYVDAARKTSTPAAEGALLHIDVDHFRATLRTYGGRCEDVVARLALLLFEVAGRQGRIGRLGLDEFGLVVPPGARPGPLDLGRALVHRIAGTDFGSAATGPLYLTASVGVAPIAHGAQPLDEIFCTADAAARAARVAGGNRAVALGPDDTRAVADLHAVRTLPTVREALRDGRLLLHCQPIVPLDASSDRLPAAEVLVRLTTADGEILHPADFLPIAERFRLTSVIDREVIERVCHWLESRASAWVDLDYLAVNLHPQSLEDGEFTAWLVRRLADVRFPACRLCLEVKESAALAGRETAQPLLQQLHDLGCRVALDDFGAGYPSLAQFLTLPVDIVKLDGAFMSGLPDDPVARELLSWVCDLCRDSDRRTVAERCSSPEVLKTVRELGIDYAQGHTVCEPFALDRLLPVVPPHLVSVA